MAISWVVFISVFGGALLGIVLRSRLPKHLSDDSKEVVKLGMGLIATMAALVLALLIASAKSSHNMQSTEVTEMSADFILLDRTLARYGPQTKEVRSLISAADRHGARTQAFALVGGDGRLHSDAFPGRTGLLASADFRKLRPVRTYKLDRNWSPARLRAVSCRGHFPSSGTGSTVPGADANF
jgi:hypothetical protein